MAEYKRILVTTDFSECALAGVEEAAGLAKQLDAEVLLVYVVQDRLPPMMLGSGLHWQDVVEKHEQTARQAVKDYAVEHLPGIPVKVEVCVGEPSETIVRIAEEQKADLIVIASHGHGLFGQFVLGSTTERVLRRASCPVLVVRPRED